MLQLKLPQHQTLVVLSSVTQNIEENEYIQAADVKSAVAVHEMFGSSLKEKSNAQDKNLARDILTPQRRNPWLLDLLPTLAVRHGH